MSLDYVKRGTPSIVLFNLYHSAVRNVIGWIKADEMKHREMSILRF